MGPAAHGLVDVSGGDGARARAGVIALWAHPRSVSTAFLRMMAERGDVTVVHEPLVLLTDHGEVAVPGVGGGTATVRSYAALLAHLAELGAAGPVFFKDTLEYHYDHLFAHPGSIAGFRHTFLVREPAATIASHHAVKPEFACREVGYEHQWALFRLAWQTTGIRPVVVAAERLLADPAGTVAAYCAATGLPYLPAALTWAPGELPQWRRNRRWHLDASASSGFAAPRARHAVTVADDPRLRAYYDHHLPYYQRLVEHAL